MGRRSAVIHAISLAHFYHTQSPRFPREAAEQLYEQALELTERVLCARHPWMVRDLRDYAELMKATGQTAKALELKRRAAAIEREQRIGG